MKVFILIAALIIGGEAAAARSFPRYNYGGKTHEEFIRDAIERSSPGNARFLAEIFGGLNLNLDVEEGSRAFISVGGAATKCQHQSPCFDSRCNACYDPLLRIHGVCGGASYFTCRGTLPKKCLPRICTYVGKGRSSAENGAIFLKTFPRFEDLSCSEGKRSGKNVDSENSTTLTIPDPISNETDNESNWILPVPDAVTACQGYDLCLDIRCASCYDGYLGTHTTCGNMTYYDCKASLPEECQPMKCTQTNINEIFPTENFNSTLEEGPLLVRNFAPLPLEERICLSKK